MNRETEMHFATNPVNIDIQRSKFDRSNGHKTTFNTGRLVPIYVDEVLPGDTVRMNMSEVIRMSTPIFPVMDNAFQDIYWFYVPSRLLWEHWVNFMGENDTTYWEQETEYVMPKITAPSGGWTKGTIADYMGIPTNVDLTINNNLPFKAFAKVYNDWFRDENNVEPLHITINDSTLAGSNGDDATVDVELGGLPPKVAKYHDMFTSALPEPQKGPDVFVPLGSSAPIVWGESRNPAITADKNAIGQKVMFSHTGSYDSQIWKTDGVNITQLETNRGNGIDVDLSEATGATINQLRQAFAVQRLYEKDARGGTRYIEQLKAHFNVDSPDARLQRSEYLGGKRIPINISQVLQTSSTDDTSPLGQTGAFSITSDSDSMFTKSFTEHGYILGMVCVRTDHTYQQGLEKLWNRTNRTDFYFPTMANLGEMPILNKEIYAQGTVEDNEAFGYQEAWAEYRYKPSKVTGEFRSNYELSLDSWHYADYYHSLPVLGKTWIEETDENVKRTLAVQEQDQFLADFYFDATWTRPMPIYSIPGLLDHH